MNDVFSLILVLHKTYISLIAFRKIWTHEIDNIPIKIGTTMYMLNTIPSPRIQIVIKKKYDFIKAYDD